MIAALGGHQPVFDRLLDRGGANQSTAGKVGMTALIKAAKGVHVPGVDQLLKRGADPSAANKNG